MKTSGAATLLLSGVMLCTATMPAIATTLQVEKDGSGDYTIIQDALDAAAPGDTVLVGPGRFADYSLRTETIIGFQFQGIAHVTTGDVVVLGSGVDQTVLGPDSYIEEIDGKITAGLTIDTGGVPAKVSGFHLENIQSPASIRSSNVTFENCTIDNRGKGLGEWGVFVIRGSNSVIRNVHVTGPDGIITAAGGVQRLLIEDCSFDDESLDGFAVTIGNGATDCTIRRCTFTRGVVGVQFSLFSSGWVEDCTFEDTRITAIDLSSGAAIVRRCLVGPGMRRPLRIGDGRLEVYDSVIGSGIRQTILTWGDLLVRNSHIEPGDSLTIDARTSLSDWEVDLASNWWGTTDTTEIWSAIDDANSRVTIDPILQGPVPTEKETVGGLKGRYRSPK